MARIDSKVVFLTTSPRTPSKMIPEISLLSQHFSGEDWKHETQVNFMRILRDEMFFNGMGEKDPAFSARDRITRAPQTLGFVVLKPKIELTEAGNALVSSKRTDEIFLRQLLKFQIPSPYHTPTSKASSFWVKPYLEIFRLINHFGTLRFDELKMFALQLTDYRDFDNIVNKIESFRKAKANNVGSYRKFVGEYFEKELRVIYANEISLGETSTRESNESSVVNFLRIKAQNMRDYADACFRYLRATGMVNVSHVGKSLSIVSEKQEDVNFFLRNTDREPCFVNDKKNYIDYLGSLSFPKLLIDDMDSLLEKIKIDFPYYQLDNNLDFCSLKEIYDNFLEERKQEKINEQIVIIKDYRLYDDIQEKYKQILDKSLYDTPLMLEWNTWRAMTMLDGGNVKTNMLFDDFGQPLSTAQGNMSDIVCDYGEFLLSVEVTMSSGQRQYEMEGEPVSRHLGKLKKETNKPVYCLFIAPDINEACIAHFFMLHKLPISFYGGYSIIVPLPLNVFQKMLEDSHKAEYIPNPENVRSFFEFSEKIATTSENEKVWYEKIISKALDWLNYNAVEN